MNTNRINHKIKVFFVMAAFVIGYVLSAYLSSVVFSVSNLSKHFGSTLWFNVGGVAVVLIGLILTKLYAVSLHRVSVMEGLKAVCISCAVLVVNIVLCLCLKTDVTVRWCFVCWLIFTLYSLFIIYCLKFSLSIAAYHGKRHLKNGKRVLIVGAGDAGTTILRELQTSDKTEYVPIGFVDDDLEKVGNYIFGVKVLGTVDDIEKIANEKDVDQIIIAMPSVNQKKLREITERCVSTKKKLQILPGVYQLINGQVLASKLKDVDVNDLLGREPVKVNLDEVMGYIENQVVLVTGGGGSIGSELCRQIATHNPKQLIILDIYENNAYELEQELKRNVPELNLVTLIASVRDSVKMDKVFATYKPDIVFHAAAHKHVPLMETSPNEAVKNNILGTYKVVKCADKYGVKRFVQISTDKAVNPTNIMGATKRVCEMIIQAYAKKSKTRFVAVRFGNVLGSNGSVIPLFKKQIACGGPVTVTHKDIIRYFMTIPEAVSLVLQAGAYAKGGEIFVLDMGEQVRIYDLAEKLIRLSGYEPNKDIEIKCTGLRPGEKLFEERLMAEEGLKKTANEKISIGKPLDIDDEKLFRTIDELYEEAYNETDKMKELVKGLVPTYEIDKKH